MVSILMATFNGEMYLSAQLDSLFAQTNNDFILYIQDDKSTDSTATIISDYQHKYPGRIVFSQLQKNTGSPKHNFLKLMAEIQDDYVMLCDQDDIWEPDKIEITLSKMKLIEEEHPRESVMVFTDLIVVDENLEVINQSFREAMNSDYARTAFNQTLIQNVLTGCTVMYNRSLSEILRNKVPKYCVMHDWWLLLVASAFAKIGHVDKQTILYRQHGRNSVGAKDVRTFSYKLKRFSNVSGIKRAIQETYLQAESFLEVYGEMITPNQKAVAKSYCEIPHINKLSRWLTVWKLGSFKIGVTRNIVYFLFI